MTVLGKFTKQPREVDWYSIQFAQDMAQTDEITEAIVTLSIGKIGLSKVIASNYSALTEDNGYVLYADKSIALPTAPSDGYVLAVANTSQAGAITVGEFALPVHAAIVIRRLNGQWVVEAEAQGILVALPGDQRVRTQVRGGVNGVTYQAQVTVTTQEGRVMENEFQVKIRES